MFFKAPLVTAFLAFGIPSHATQIFRNTGTTGGWDFINREHKGTVDQVSNVVYEGSTALKMTQTYDPAWTGRYHSEVVKNNVYRRGDTGYYGFAFRLSDTWQFSPTQNYNIAQFIADFTDVPGNCDDWMPSSMVWLVGNQLSTRVKQGTLCAQRTETFSNIATVTAGVWHKIVIQASWKTDGTGFVSTILIFLQQLPELPQRLLPSEAKLTNAFVEPEN